LQKAQNGRFCAAGGVWVCRLRLVMGEKKGLGACAPWPFACVADPVQLPRGVLPLGAGSRRRVVQLLQCNRKAAWRRLVVWVAYTPAGIPPALYAFHIARARVVVLMLHGGPYCFR
jgi:hypothetical protein